MLTGAEPLIVDALAKGLIGQLVKSGWEGITKNELLQANVGDLWRDGILKNLSPRSLNIALAKYPSNRFLTEADMF